MKHFLIIMACIKSIDLQNINILDYSAPTNNGIFQSTNVSTGIREIIYAPFGDAQKQYSYGMWTKWLISYPSYLKLRQNIYTMGRITLEKNDSIYNYTLAIFLEIGNYRINSSSNSSQIPYNHEISDQLEGKWNFIYIAASANTSQVWGCVIDSNNLVIGFTQHNDYQLPTAIDFIRFVLKQELDYPLFNGYFSNITIGYQPPYFINNVNVLITLMGKNLLPISAFPDLTQRTIIVNKDDTNFKKFKPFEFNQFQEVQEYSISGWIKWDTLIMQNQMIAKLSMMPLSLVQENNKPGDRVLSILTNTQNQGSLFLVTYNCYTEQCVHNNIYQWFGYDVPVPLQTWTYLYFGYSRPLHQVYGLLNQRAYQRTLLWTNMTHLIAHDWTFFLIKDNFNIVFEGQVGKWELNFGKGSYLNQAWTIQRTCSNQFQITFSKCTLSVTGDNRTIDLNSTNLFCKSGYYDNGQQKCKDCQLTVPALTPCIGSAKSTSCNQLYGSRFFNSGGICTVCNFPCYECIDSSASTCTSCLDTSYFNGTFCVCIGEHRSDQKSCICDATFYDKAGVCNPCLAPCLNCYQEKLCDTCITGEHRSDQKSCICDATFYDKAGVCTPCLAPCLNCYQEKLCDTCITGEHRSDQKSCLCDATFYDKAGVCTPCLAPCLNCSDANVCTQCLLGEHRTNLYSCLCDDNYFNQLGICIHCIYPCANCLTAQICTICSSADFRKDQQECSCLSSYFDNNKQCEICDSSCETCLLKPSFCLTCYVYQKRKLSNQFNTCDCYQGFFTNWQIEIQDTCEQCSSTCQICIITKDQCEKCFADQNREINLIFKNCQCIIGYFIHDDKDLCEKCDQNCMECSLSSDNCTNCDFELKKRIQKNKCVCLDGYYADQVNSCQGQNILMIYLFKACFPGCSICKSFSNVGCDQSEVDSSSDIGNVEIVISVVKVAPAPAAKFAPDCPLSYCSNCLEDKNICQQCLVGYFVKDGLCIACDDICQDCLGQSQVCSSCKYGKDQMENCVNCNQINKTRLGQICVAICGDGLVDQVTEECDDANQNNDDGCTKNCKILTPPIKIQAQPTLPTQTSGAQQFNKTRQLIIQLPQGFVIPTTRLLQINESINQTSSSERFFDDWDLSIEGMSPDGYKMNFIYDPKLNALVVDYSLSESMVSKSIKVQTSPGFQPPELSLKIPDFVQVSNKIEEQTKQSIKTVSILMYTILGVVIFSILSGNLQLIWNIVDLIQIMSYFNYCNVVFPYNLQSFFVYLASFNFNQMTQYFPEAKNYSLYLTDKYALYIIPRPKFQDMNMNTLFIYNSIGVFTIFFSSFLLFIMAQIYLFVLDRGQKSQQKQQYQQQGCVGKFFGIINISIINKCQIIRQQFFYSGLLRVIIQLSYDLNVILFLEIFNQHFYIQETFLKLSTIFAVIILVLYIYLIALLYRKLSSTIIFSLNTDQQKNLGCLYEGLNQDSQIWKYFTLIVLVKKFINAACFIFIYDESFFQALFPSISSIIFVLIIGTFSPFEKKTDNIKMMIVEFTSFLVYIILSLMGLKGLKKFRDVEFQNIIGWLIIGICLACIISQIIIDICINFSECKEVILGIKQTLFPSEIKPIKLPRSAIIKKFMFRPNGKKLAQQMIDAQEIGASNNNSPFHTKQIFRKKKSSKIIPKRTKIVILVQK